MAKNAFTFREERNVFFGEKERGVSFLPGILVFYLAFYHFFKGWQQNVLMHPWLEKNKWSSGWLVVVQQKPGTDLENGFQVS